MAVAFGTHSGKQLISLTDEAGNRLKWWHKIDVPTIQMLMAEESVFAELSWPDLIRHRGAPAVGQCEDSEFNFTKNPAISGAVSIMREGTEVGQIKTVIGRPSVIDLGSGHSYTLRNEGYLREDWILVDENGEPLFKMKRIYPDVQVSGEVELLGKGATEPPMLLLLMAAWYVVQ